MPIYHHQPYFRNYRSCGCSFSLRLPRVRSSSQVRYDWLKLKKRSDWSKFKTIFFIELLSNSKMDDQFEFQELEQPTLSKEIQQNWIKWYVERVLG